MQPDQNELLEVLDKQRQQQTEIDRILKVVLPILAFLLCVICAAWHTARISRSILGGWY